MSIGQVPGPPPATIVPEPAEREAGSISDAIVCPQNTEAGMSENKVYEGKEAEAGDVPAE